MRDSNAVKRRKVIQRAKKVYDGLEQIDKNPWLSLLHHQFGWRYTDLGAMLGTSRQNARERVSRWTPDRGFDYLPPGIPAPPLLPSRLRTKSGLEIPVLRDITTKAETTAAARVQEATSGDYPAGVKLAHVVTDLSLAHLRLAKHQKRRLEAMLSLYLDGHTSVWRAGGYRTQSVWLTDKARVFGMPPDELARLTEDELLALAEEKGIARLDEFEAREQLLRSARDVLIETAAVKALTAARNDIMTTMAASGTTNTELAGITNLTSGRVSQIVTAVSTAA